MAAKQYRISKITQEWDLEFIGGNVERQEDGKIISLVNVDNPFEYITKHVPEYAFTEEEFQIGRVIEMEDDQ